MWNITIAFNLSIRGLVTSIKVIIIMMMMIIIIIIIIIIIKTVKI